MKWAVLNACGGLAWLAGLVFAKGAGGPAAPYLASNGHNLAIGSAMGIAGLALLLWVNLRSAS